MCVPVRGVDCRDPKVRSWNPTSPREAHGDVFIRSDLPPMCRGFFPTVMCFGREQNYEGYGTQSGQYLYS